MKSKETRAAKISVVSLVAPMVAAVSLPLCISPVFSSPYSAASSVSSITRSRVLIAAKQSDDRHALSRTQTTIDVNAAEQEIIQTALDGKLPEAEKKLELIISHEKNVSRKVDMYYMLAALEKMQEKSGDARRHLETVLHHEPPAIGTAGQLRHALLLKRIGDCYYGERKYHDALANYNAALIISSALPGNSRILADLYESAMGILMVEKRYTDAQSYAEKLLSVTAERAKSGLWDDAGVLFWAQLQTLNLYRHMKNPPNEELVRKEVSASLEKLMNFRFGLESHGKLPSLTERKEIFEKHYISEFAPKSPAEYIWLAGEFRIRTLPVIGWMPTDRATRAAILCVHGLGLDNQAFTPFGMQMSARGYAVYAMDVRGFGAWLTTPGQEDLRLNEAINDVGSVLGLIGDRHAGVPIYLLGESMGGAIALRAGEKYSQDLHGVIASVPSAERFQAKKMGLTVAVHFLKNPNKPFRVGDMVVNQATANPSVREVWHDDLKAKMEMSPKELMRFAVFMRDTKQICPKLKTMPVFFVQGLKDKLVKPKGTYELFEAVSSQDKNLFIIGTEEHLIFETLKQSGMLIEALTAWMDKHATAPVAPQGVRPKP
ncbi:MAG: alpha/beta fold hydrolase [Candidatus Melainabacteria bacterium]|nr:alpha/beta fold hydrolase [Candidatus Melainabacteria bacterium]